MSDVEYQTERLDHLGIVAGIQKEITSMDFSRYPKVELHLHLDCSLSYNVVHRINPAITEEAYRHDFIAPSKCTNLADFLTRAPQGIALMQTEEQLRLVVFDVFEQLQRDHLLYVEIRFAPLLHTHRGLSPEQVVEVVEAATSQACASTGIEARLILCTLRHFSSEQSLQTAQLVERFRGTRVAALDLAGDEAGFPLAPHIPAYQYDEISHLISHEHSLSVQHTPHLLQIVRRSALECSQRLPSSCYLSIDRPRALDLSIQVRASMKLATGGR